jgi:hypothetical protein
VIDSDRAGLPSKYHNGLLVTSRGEHRLEFYRPTPMGASVRAERVDVIQGDENFRPVALASGPDGSVYFTDWVDRDYSVHSKGRIWRLSSAASTKPPKTKPSPARERMLDLVGADSLRQADELTRALSEEDPFIRSAAVTALAKPAFKSQVAEWLKHSDARVRLGALLASRRGRMGDAASVIERALSDADENVRLAAVLWAGEEEVRGVTAARRDIAPNPQQRRRHIFGLCGPGMFRRQPVVDGGTGDAGGAERNTHASVVVIGLVTASQTAAVNEQHGCKSGLQRDVQVQPLTGVYPIGNVALDRLRRSGGCTQAEKKRGA